VLAQLIERLAAELDGWDGPPVELCVSDNASADGTQELVQAANGRLPCRVVYHRQAENVGLARNLLQVVELASGRFCWLLGSDDLIAPGGLRAVCDAVRREPDATGHVIAGMDVDPVDPSLRSRQPPRDFHPPGEGAAVYETAADTFAACGNAWTAISWNVLDRRAWLRAAREHRGLVLAHPTWPQVVTMGLMARERARWAWWPDPVVLHRRNADPFLFERSPTSIADRWAELVGGLAAAWGALLGRGTPAWHARMRALATVWGSASDARAAKLYERPSLRAQARLAVTWTRAFWKVPGWPRHVLPALACPAWLTTLRHSPTRGTVGAGPLQPPGDRVAVDAELPARLAAGGSRQVLVQVRNDGARTLPVTGPHAVGLWQRWTVSSRWLRPEEVGLNALAAAPLGLPGPVAPGQSVAAWVALLPPREPGRYRLAVAAHQHGLGWLDYAGVGAAVEREVDVS
jgi:abequosyltransferase